MSDQRLIADLIYSTQFKEFYDLTNDEVDALVTEIERLRVFVSTVKSASATAVEGYMDDCDEPDPHNERYGFWIESEKWQAVLEAMNSDKQTSDTPTIDEDDVKRSLEAAGRALERRERVTSLNSDTEETSK